MADRKRENKNAGVVLDIFFILQVLCLLLMDTTVYFLLIDDIFSFQKSFHFLLLLRFFPFMLDDWIRVGRFYMTGVYVKIKVVVFGEMQKTSITIM